MTHQLNINNECSSWHNYRDIKQTDGIENKEYFVSGLLFILPDPIMYINSEYMRNNQPTLCILS